MLFHGLASDKGRTRHSAGGITDVGMIYKNQPAVAYLSRGESGLMSLKH